MSLKIINDERKLIVLQFPQIQDSVTPVGFRYAVADRLRK